ncbi:MAG: FAD-linked oxidase C-terminal domain-containing protein [Actinomycetota bacterium]|nr:FAD-linked oxidase C-terminal domain-containing protein [Actinomycetota bacterium]
MKKKYLQQLQEIVGQDFVFTDPEDMIAFSYDSTRLEYLPEAVVRPQNAKQVSQVMKLAYQEGIPVTPRGAATGLSGGCLPVKGGLILATVNMNRIFEVNPVDLLIEAEAGAITEEVDLAARKYNLFYPPDPGSMNCSTIGGNIAENAGGLRGLKYGVTKDYVSSMEVVLPTGEIVNLGTRTVKGVTGYNLKDLIVGSEGTLGIVTRATLKLLPVPPARASLLALFGQLTDAAQTVRDIVAEGIITATLEIVDNVTINAIEDYLGIGLDRSIGAMLLIEVDGQQGAVEAEAETVKKVCQKNNASSCQVATSAQERDTIWAARRAALSSLARVKPSTILEDATIPRSRIVELVEAVNAIAQKYDMMIGTFGHAGDGNLHPTLLTDLRIPEEQEKVEKVIEEIFEATIALGGTLSGEHGIGISKAKYLKMEISDDVFGLMKRVKKAFDPDNILNPGKMYFDS